MNIHSSARGGGFWLLVAGLMALPALLPLVAIALALPQAQAETWAHLWQHVLPRVSANTFWLLLGVGVGVSVLGTVLAALVAFTEFPGRRFFSWALLLPLALPGYVMATVMIGVFDWSGALATRLRGVGILLPEIRSRGGVILTLVAVLYPYVYLVARGAFLSQGARALEMARSLGHAPLAAWLRVVLPLAAPWIAGGTLLALMETLADFGTVSAFNYDTYTSAIYKAWFALFSIETALQLAAILVLMALALLALEQRLRRGRRFHQQGPAPARLRLGRARGLATALCTSVFLFAFALPATQLLLWAADHVAALDARDWTAARNAVTLALSAALLTTAAALLLALAARRRPGASTQAATRVALLGYALPGPLLALGLYVPFAVALRTLNDWGWALSAQGGLALMLCAYTARFMAVAHTPVNNGLLRIGPSLEEAARLLGVHGSALLQRVHLPLLRGSLAGGALLVFVDVMKEMPITLMTRPFGWDTLAVRVFELTSEGEWARAALPSLGIVLAGLLPVLLLNRGALRET